MNENAIECPKCHTRYRVPAEIRATAVPCKKCGTTISLGKPAARATAEPAPTPAPGARARHGSPRSHSPSDRSHLPHSSHHAHHPRAKQESESAIWIYILCGVGAIGGAVALIAFLPKTRTPEFREVTEPKPPSSAAHVASQAHARAPVVSSTASSGAVPASPPSAPPLTAATPSPVSPTPKNVYPAQKVGHLATTSAELRTRIDEALGKVLDLSNPRSSSTASHELEEIGEPAVPRLLSAWVDLKMDDSNDAIRGNLIDQVLQTIFVRTSKYRPQGETPDDVRRREAARDAWFQWWGDHGGSLQPAPRSDAHEPTGAG
jgi:predicted Zn finger-like uncharacterized protein